jgi:hypothetical protein
MTDINNKLLEQPQINNTSIIKMIYFIIIFIFTLSGLICYTIGNSINSNKYINIGIILLYISIIITFLLFCYLQYTCRISK